jgi:ABC-type transport system substrate-binding protein
MKLFFITALLVTTSSFALVTPNPKAPTGGVFNINIEQEPESLHPIMSGDVYSSYVHGYGLDGLCENDINTYEFKPRLAEKWEVSKDGLIFTFFLRKGAMFHNGEPVTAEDVKFTLEAIRNPKHEALNLIPYYEKIQKIDVIDPHTIKFTASEKYFKNMTFLCGLTVIPKSVYGDIAKSVKLHKEFVGAGPYVLEKNDKGQAIILKKFDKWYGWNLPEFKGVYNFDKIAFRVTKDDNITVERFKKGELDYASFSVADQYLKATGKPFKKKHNAGKFTGLAVTNFSGFKCAYSFISSC